MVLSEETSLKGIGFKNRKLSDFSWVNRPKNHFGIMEAKAMA